MWKKIFKPFLKKRASFEKVKKRFFSIVKKIPYILFYVFDLALITVAVLVAIQLFIALTKDFEGKDPIQILVGIGATLLSLVIGLTGLVSFIVNSINTSKNNHKNQIEATTKLIEDFNNNVLNDLNIVTRVLRLTQSQIKWNGQFEPLFNDQEKAVNDFQNHLAANKINYKEILFYFSAQVLYVENNELNPEMSKFCDYTIKSGLKNANKGLPTIGGTQLLYVFKRKRISILNYFEKLSICYINKTIDPDLVEEQFCAILLRLIPLVYYEIYRLEKLSSYPYLNKMLEIMQTKEFKL